MDRLGWVVRKSYRIGDRELGIRTTSHVFGAWMSRMLNSYEVDASGESIISVVMKDDPRGIHSLYRGISPVLRSTDPSVLRHGLVEELEALSLPQRDDAAFLYGTLVTMDEVSCVIPSYLAPYLARSRLYIESLRVAMSLGPAVSIDQIGRIGPVPRRLALPVDADHERDSINDATVAAFEAPEGRRVDAVCWFSQDARKPVDAVGRARALLVLASESANLWRAPERVLGALSQLVQGADCMELCGDTPRSMLLTLAEALGAKRPSDTSTRRSGERRGRDNIRDLPPLHRSPRQSGVSPLDCQPRE